MVSCNSLKQKIQNLLTSRRRDPQSSNHSRHQLEETSTGNSRPAGIIGSPIVHAHPATGHISDKERYTDCARTEVGQVKRQTLGSNTEVEHPNLWDLAYEDLQDKDPAAVDNYESFLIRQNSAKASRTQYALRQLATLPGGRRPQILAEILAKQYEVYLEDQWKVRVGKEDVPVQEVVNKIVGIVATAKDFITIAASQEPHAALAWAGFAVTLEFLLASTRQESEAISGLSDIGIILLRYRVVQQLYLDDYTKAAAMSNNARDLWLSWRKNTVELYREILLYQYRLADHYCMDSVHRFARNMVQADEWKTILSRIKNISSVGDDYERSLKGLDSHTLDAIRASTQEQDAKIDEMIRRMERDEWAQKSERLGDWLQSMLQSMHQKDAYRSSHEHLRNERRVDGEVGTARTYITDVRRWLDEDTVTFFWTSGVPGVGKSMAVSATIDHVEQHLLDLNLDGMAFIYFEWHQKANQTDAAVFASLLYQLRTRSAQLANSLQKFYDDESSKSSWPSSENLAKQLSNLRSATDDKNAFAGNNSRLLLIFDALDEATPKTQSAVLKLLQTLDQAVFRVLVTTRQGFFLPESLTSVDRRPHQAEELEIETSVRERLVRRRPETERNPVLLSRLIENIKLRSKGNFLQAVILADFVSAAGTQSSKMLAASEQNFCSLADVYEKSLMQIQEIDDRSQEAILALAWLAFAKRSLGVRELGEALAHDSDSGTFDREDMPDIYRITELCRFLIYLDKQQDSVRLAHQTVAEYLRQLPVIRACLPKIARVCLATLKRVRAVLEPNLAKSQTHDRCSMESESSLFGTTFVRNVPIEFSGHDQPHHNYSLFDYAASFWADHLREAEPFGDRDLISLALHAYITESRSGRLALIENTVDCESAQSKGRNDLAISCFLDHLQLSQHLLEFGKPSHDELVEAFYWAATRNSVRCLKLVHSFSANCAETSKQQIERSPLLASAANGSDECLTYLLQIQLFDVNSKGPKNTTALSLAAKGSHEKAALQLLRQHPGGRLDVNSRDFFFWTPLFWAVSAGSFETVRLLLDDDRTDVNAIDTDGRTALSYACEYGMASIVRLFVSKDIVLLCARRPNGTTPLIYAVQSRDWQTVANLCGRVKNDTMRRYGSPFLEPDTNGRNAVSFAAEQSDTQILRILIENFPELACVPDRNGWLPLAWTCQPPGHLRNAARLISLSKDCIDQRDYSGSSALISAAKWGPADIVHLIVTETNANVNLQDESGRTALSFAASRGSLDIVEILITFGGADSHTTDHRGLSAISWAMSGGHDNVVEYLSRLVA